MQVDITTMPRILRVSTAIEIALSVFFFALGVTQPKPWMFFIVGSILLLDVVRILGWKLEMTTENLRVRRYFVWRSISWTEIHTISVGDTWGRGQQAVRLGLASRPWMSLGAFPRAFALSVRDGLRAEMIQRQGARAPV